MPQNWVDYLNKFGMVGMAAALIWAIHTGRLYLARELDYVHESYKKYMDELTQRLQVAERELQSQRDLLNKVVNHYIGGEKT